jgi:repressor LexA
MQSSGDIEAPTPVEQRTSATDRQLEVLAWISAYIARLGYSPSLRDIGKAHGIASTNGVLDHLWALRRKGLVTWVEGRARTLRVLEVKS